MNPQDYDVPSCLIDALRISATIVPDNEALLAPDRPGITYTQLMRHIEHTVGVLNGFGLTRGACVAIVAPNGVETASLMVSVAAACTVLVLNPEAQANEFDSFFKQSSASAVIIPKGMSTPARSIAQAQGIRVIEMIPTPGTPEALFELEGGHEIPATYTTGDDIFALVPTSGTSGLPKLVTYVQQRAWAQLYMPLVRSFAATPDSPKYVQNMLPLFHVYGFMNVIGGLVSGHSMVCYPSFSVKEFFAGLDKYHPTQFAALPVTWRMIIKEASAYQDVISRSSLILTASTSAPLTTEEAMQIQNLFHVPLILSYGLTEIPGMTISSPFIPGTYKSGSVGKPDVPMSVIDEQGHVLPAGQLGEVVIAGDAVLSRYEGNPAANAEMFRDEWFHTGDLGYIDEDGFVFLIGRIKEIINRGGEKISPYEVEDMLIQHPAVTEAVVFGVPHLALGEDVAAAVVVNDPEVHSKTIRKFATEHLAPQKVPNTILIVEQIPKTPTGKVRRLSLPELLGLNHVEHHDAARRSALAPPPTPARTETESRLLTLWSALLNAPDIGIHDDFFDFGGTSLQAAQLVLEIAKTFDRTITLSTLFGAPTVAEMTKVLSEQSASAPTLVPLQPFGDKPALFCIPGYSGQVISYQPLAQQMGVDQPLYGLQPPGIDGKVQPLTRIEDLAAHYIQAMRAMQPNGPYFVAGYSIGAVLTLEVAHQLRAQGESVPLVIMFEGLSGEAVFQSFSHAADARQKRLMRQVKHVFTQLSMLDTKEKVDYLQSRVRARIAPKAPKPPEELLPGVEQIRRATDEALKHYELKPCESPVLMFVSGQQRRPERADAYKAVWAKLAAAGIDFCEVPGTHKTMMHEPNVQVLAEMLKARLAQALAAETS